MEPSLNLKKPQSTSLVRRFMALPLREKASTAIQLLRGLLLRGKLDQPAWILAGPGVKLARRNGSICVDRLLTLEQKVQIAVIGKDAARPARLSIGYNTHIMDRTKINAADQITIGSECNISWDCDILDTDFHILYNQDGSYGPISAPIVIEDRVWVGSNVIILKGVTIGHDSVVAAGAVVTKSMPPYSLVGGNPARVIKQIGGWER